MNDIPQWKVRVLSVMPRSLAMLLFTIIDMVDDALKHDTTWEVLGTVLVFGLIGFGLLWYVFRSTIWTIAFAGCGLTWLTLLALIFIMMVCDAGLSIYQAYKSSRDEQEALIKPRKDKKDDA